MPRSSLTADLATSEAAAQPSMLWLRRRGARVFAGLGEGPLRRVERGLPLRFALWLLPVAMRVGFKREQARGLDAKIEFRWPTPEDGLHCAEAVLHDGRLEIRRGRCSRPTATITMSIADTLRTAIGTVATPVLVSEGRVLMGGDVMTLMRIPALFGLPAEPLVEV